MKITIVCGKERRFSNVLKKCILEYVMNTMAYANAKKAGLYEFTFDARKITAAQLRRIEKLYYARVIGGMCDYGREIDASWDYSEIINTYEE